MEIFHSYNESNWIEWKERIVGWEWGLIDLFWLLFLHYHDDDPKMFGFLSRKKIFDFQQLSENKKWMGKKGCSWETSTWKNSMHNWWMIRNCESKSVWARCVVKMWKMRRSTKVQAHTHTYIPNIDSIHTAWWLVLLKSAFESLLDVQQIQTIKAHINFHRLACCCCCCLLCI